MSKSPKVLTGLDRISAGDKSVLRAISGRRIGLLAHPASVDGRLRHARDVLNQAGCAARVLFGPEHGFEGHAQDMEGIDSENDVQNVIPVYSIYGNSESELQPRSEWLQNLDVVVIDLQDVGSRYYTYVWSAALMLKTAASCGVETLVLDRPNPLGGVIVEGAPQRSGYRSFVGLYDVSVRHGMTIGEILTMVRRVEGLESDSLRIIKMKGWQRDMLFQQTGLPWVMPSPNMPTICTAQVYPGACLLEGTLLSEGRGTTRPFEIWGAPYVDGVHLAKVLQADGVRLRPLCFTPTFHKYVGETCGGVQVHVTDATSFRPYEFYLNAIAKTRELTGDAFAWRTETYEFVTDRPAIDLLTGGSEFREAVDNEAGLSEVLAAERSGARVFEQNRKQDLLY